MNCCMLPYRVDHIIFSITENPSASDTICLYPTLLSSNKKEPIALYCDFDGRYTLLINKLVLAWDYPIRTSPKFKGFAYSVTTIWLYYLKRFLFAHLSYLSIRCGLYLILQHYLLSIFALREVANLPPYSLTR